MTTQQMESAIHVLAHMALHPADPITGDDAATLESVIASKTHPAATSATVDLDAIIYDSLLEIGCSAQLLGFKYLQFALKLAVVDGTATWGRCGALYMTVAERFGITPQSVERCIRHAIEYAALNGDPEVFYTVFGNTTKKDSGKPTNSQFISSMVEFIRRNKTAAELKQR